MFIFKRLWSLFSTDELWYKHLFMIILRNGKAFRPEMVIFHKIISGINTKQMYKSGFILCIDQVSAYTATRWMICPSLNLEATRMIPYVMIILVPKVYTFIASRKAGMSEYSFSWFTIRTVADYYRFKFACIHNTYLCKSYYQLSDYTS